MKETVNHVCQHTTCKLATSVPQQFCFRLFVLRPLKEEHWTNSWVHVSAANVTNDESTERQCCRQFKCSIFTPCTKNATQKDKRAEDLVISVKQQTTNTNKREKNQQKATNKRTISDKVATSTNSATNSVNLQRGVGSWVKDPKWAWPWERTHPR